AFRDIMQDDRAENDRAQPSRNQEAGSNGDAVKESVDRQPSECRVSDPRIEELVSVGLFPEVEVGRPGVFEEMYNEIAEQYHERSAERLQMQACGNHFRERGRQHKTRAQSNEVREKKAAPGARADDRAAEDVGETRHDPQHEADRERGHEQKPEVRSQKSGERLVSFFVATFGPPSRCPLGPRSSGQKGTTKVSLF